jgi:hypothetical protein
MYFQPKEANAALKKLGCFLPFLHFSFSLFQFLQIANGQPKAKSAGEIKIKKALTVREGYQL